MRKDVDRKNIEILAPAGSILHMKAAYNAGADAVYMGGSRFGARAYADNPDEEMLKYAIDYAHIHNKKLYLTLNTLLKDRELEGEVYGFLRPYYEEGLDGIIVQDFGLFSMLRTLFPDLPIHGSTQMTITGLQMAQWMAQQGASRIVPARELSLEEIRLLRAHTDLELEVFVQGALCYCYSGQCLMSSIIGGRSGNRGRCAQPCRLPYMEADSGKSAYLLSPKDICTLSDLPELIDAGVNSFKIEGRMKKPEYAAMTAFLYRYYADLYLEKGAENYRVDEKDVQRLMDLYNRGGFSGGYLKMHNGPEMMATKRPNHWGVSVGYTDRWGQIHAEKELMPGDMLELRREGWEDVVCRVERRVLAGEKFMPSLDKKDGKKAGTLEARTVYRVRNQALLESIQEDFLKGELKEKIYGALRIVKDLPAMLNLTWGGISVSVEGAVAEAAKNQPMTEAALRKPIQKTGNTPFEFAVLEIETDNQSFIPNQKLNELRRNGLEQLTEACLKEYRRRAKAYEAAKKDEHVAPKDEIVPLYVMLSGSETLKKGVKVLTDETDISRFYVEIHEVEDMEGIKTLKRYGREVYACLPVIFREADRQKLETLIEDSKDWADGYLVRQLESFHLIKGMRPEAKVVFDRSIYAWNQRAKQFFKSQGAESLTASQELNYSELFQLGCEDMEMIIYGYQPLMVSAQCVKKTQGGCTKKPGMIQLTDRQRKPFYVYNECAFCFNRIYNGLPTMLMDKKKEVLRLNPKAVRMEFTMENEAQMKALTGSYRDIYLRNEKAENILKDFTRGHFARGVE